MSLPIESNVFEAVADFCVVASAVGCVYLLIASVAILRFPRIGTAVLRQPVPVTVLKPLHGTEPDMLRRLSAFCSQDYGAPVQVVCGVQAPTDPATAVVKRLAADSTTAVVDLKIDERQHGTNRKISNLVNMLPEARHPLLVISDSDIDVGPDYLSKVVAELQKPDVIAVTCVYHGVAAPGRWSQHAALAINTHFLPGVIAGLHFGLARPCFGSTIAMHHGTLARIGGFKSVADCLADDYAIGEAVRSLGYDVAIPSFTIGHMCSHETLQSLLSHEVRAARTIKTIDPIGYFGSLITHPFPLALLAMLFGYGDAIFLAAFAVLCRGIVCVCVERAFALPRQQYRLIPLQDLLSFWIFVSSFVGSRVTWRGFTYRVGAASNLMPDRRPVE